MWSGISLPSVEQVLNTTISRRQLWLATAAFSTACIGSYWLSLQRPTSVRAPTDAPLDRAQTYAALKNMASRAESAKRVVDRMKQQLAKSGLDEEAVTEACSAEMRRLLQQAEAAAAVDVGVDAEDVKRSWAYYSTKYEQSLDEDDMGDDVENEEDAADDEAAAAAATLEKAGVPSLRAVVRAGWGVKRAGTRHLLEGELLVEAMQAFGRACERAVAPVFLQVQTRLDAADVMSMGASDAQRELMTQLQGVQQAVLAKGEERLVEEFGLSRTDLAPALSRLQVKQPEIRERCNAAVSGFQSSLQREMSAIVAAYNIS